MDYTDGRETTGLRSWEEARQAERVPLAAPLRVSPISAAGLTGRLAAQGLNLSTTGMAFLTAEPLPVGTVLYMELVRTGSMAIGLVRSCARRGAAWRIGAEFTTDFISMS